MNEPDPNDSQLQTGGGAYIGGNVNVQAGDFIGRDKIINYIQQIQQRALTKSEEAKNAHEFEIQYLALGIKELAEKLQAQVRAGEEGDPFKGLVAYDLGDSDIFFGRSTAIGTFLNRLESGPLTILHAESGAGKTSLLQAGIQPRLVSAGHLAICLRPYNTNPDCVIRSAFLTDPDLAPNLTARPLHEFIREITGILSQSTYVYLFMDQFEEFFNFLTKEERQPFLLSLSECLRDPKLNVRWVLALRAEAFSYLAELEDYGIAPFQNTFRLDRMTREEALEAIREPANQRGLNLEIGLPEAILEGLQEEQAEINPAQLQIVCFAMLEDVSKSGELTLKDYHTLGGAQGILGNYLHNQVDSFPDAERNLAWMVLRALVTWDIKRAIRTQGELAKELREPSQASMKTVLDRLIARRLVVMGKIDGDTSYELAHDYLAQEIDLDPHEKARKSTQELLTQELRAYQQTGSLIAEERLASMRPFLEELVISPEAQDLLTKSQKEVNRQAAEQERRRRQWLAAAVFAAVIFAVLAAFGFGQARQARSQAEVSLARQLAAQAGELLTLEPFRDQQAVLISLESLYLHPERDANQVLAEALRLLPKFVARMNLKNGVNSLAFSQDGQRVISVDGDATIREWDAATGMEMENFSPDGQPVNSVDFDVDGKIRVWDVASGKEVASFSQEDGIESVAISTDGQRVVSATDDGTIRVWDVASGEEVSKPMTHSGVTSVAFSPDGQRVVSVDNFDGTIRVWDVASGKEVGTPINHSGVKLVARTSDLQRVVLSVDMSRDGQRVVSAGSDGSIRVWDVASGEEIARMTHNGNNVSAVAFSPDGQRVASAGDDGTIRMWDVASKEYFTYKSIGSSSDIDGISEDSPRVSSVAFSPDNQRVVSGGDNRKIRVWDVASGEEVASFSQEGGVESVAFSQDGQRVFSAGSDGTIRVWDVASGKEVASFSQEDGAESVAISQDGQRVVSAGSKGTIRVWDVASGKEVSKPMTHEGKNVESVAISQDGQRVVSASDDGTIQVWDVASGKEVGKPMTHDGESVMSVALSKGGERVVSGGSDGTVRVWDVASGEEITRMTHAGKDVLAVAFSPDGQRIVDGSSDGTIRVWLWRADDLIKIACKRLERNLTQEEWKQYMGDREYHRTCENLPPE